MLQHENQQVKDLLCYMSDLGFDFEVLGGYPRDLHFGRTPRDMDVCCWNCKPETVLWRNRYVKLLTYLQETGLYKSDFAVNSEYPSDRIFGGLRTTVNVDIIFWVENFNSAEAILGWFDYNINQFRLVRDEYTGVTAGAPWEHMFNYGRLKQLRETELSEVRIKNTLKLAKDVGWLEKSTISYPWGGVQ